jgi:uncharacterized protein YjbI with pentapeptide repeats
VGASEGIGGMANHTTVEELLKACNEAAVHARTIWVTYLLFGTYLAIAIGSTTHRDLLLENPVTLPLLNVGLELVTFFWVAPMLFVIYHLYTLLAHFVLAGKLHAFNSALNNAALLYSVQEEYRWRLHSSFVAQAIAGPERSGLITFGMRAITWITLALAPAILLLSFQVRFLPYHDPLMTWFHRGFLLIDVILVWGLWPLVLHPSGRWSDIVREIGRRTTSVPLRIFERVKNEGPDLLKRLVNGPNRRTHFRRFWTWQRGLNREAQSVLRSLAATGYLAVLSLVMIFISVAVATVPGEDVEQFILRVATKPESWFERQVADTFPVYVVTNRPILAVTATFFDGEVNPVTQRPATPFSRNLVLIDEDLSGGGAGLRLRGRDLRFANFAGSRLAKADLSSALLTQANLRGTILVNAELRRAKLEGADLTAAELGSAHLDAADLRGARLARTHLEGASMERVTLIGAHLSGAYLQGANLTGAKLLAAELNHAQLQGADLDQTDLRAADLVNADLQGANLQDARLHAAVLRGANLKAAELLRSQLQGANFSAAVIELANFRGSDFTSEIDWPALATEIEQEIEELTRFGVVIRHGKANSLKRRREFSPGKPATPAEGFSINFDPDDPYLRTDWPALESDDFEMKVARYLRELACANASVAESVVSRWGWRVHLAGTLRAGLDDSDCVGLHNLPEELKHYLRRIAAQAESK